MWSPLCVSTKNCQFGHAEPVADSAPMLSLRLASTRSAENSVFLRLPSSSPSPYHLRNIIPHLKLGPLRPPPPSHSSSCRVSTRRPRGLSEPQSERRRSSTRPRAVRRVSGEKEEEGAPGAGHCSKDGYARESERRHRCSDEMVERAGSFLRWVWNKI